MEPNRRRKKLWLAILASVAVHLLVAFSLVAFNATFAPTPEFEEEDKPLELTMIDLGSEAPTPPPRPRYIETDQSKETTEQPTEKTFESNANSIAASKVPPSGDAPLPSQEGRERPFIDFQTQQSSLASQGSQSQPAPPVPTPAPRETPAPAQTPTPQPSATAKSTSLPETSAAREQLTMLSTPPPPLRDAEEVEPTPPPAASAPPVLPRPLPERPATAYQPQKEETKITGSITNRGPSAANAVATPLGRYRKQVSDAIGARWYYYVQAKSDLASIGTARVLAEVDSEGRMQNLRIAFNSANEAFANICLQSFQEAQIPPIPPDLVPTL
ncbi:MAG: hypothetical protein H0T11_03310, partial [Chthoniobacterales bacterium]|nr:hypothetical protein [Chthoniobacterales bacterium]